MVFFLFAVLMSRSLKQGETGGLNTDLHKHPERSLATKCVRCARPTLSRPCTCTSPPGAEATGASWWGQGTGGREPMPGR